jgi:hypothetical protein
MRSVLWICRIVAATALATALVGVAWGCPPLPTGPVGVIDLRADQWDDVKFGPYDFQRDPNTNGTLRDVAPGDQYWLARGTTAITTIRGAAHSGYSGLSQAEADARVAKIQIWAWRDTNGNGRADPGDTTTEWVLLSEITPGVNGAHVVGYEVPVPHAITMPDCASCVGDVLQTSHGGTAITVAQKQSWLLLIRVVSATDPGCTNLSAATGMENWDDGNGNGSGVANDRYIAADGTWCEGSGKDGQRAIADHSIVWIYVPSN